MNGPVQEILAAIRKQTTLVPRVGVVLGSGLGGAADRVALEHDGKKGATFATSDLPGWPRSTVKGHEGKLVLGWWNGTPVAVLRGRTHAYEGYPLDVVTRPHRALVALGIETLLVTNAVGTFNPSFAPGDLMLVRDHINQIGRNGLFAAEELPRVVGHARPYTPDVLDTLRAVAREEKIRLREGILLAGKGPAYETAAEIRMARLWGADAACMSSAHEMDLGAALGLKTGAVSCITNYGTGMSPHALTHHEVEQVAGEAASRLERLIGGAVGRL